MPQAAELVCKKAAGKNCTGENAYKNLFLFWWIGSNSVAEDENAVWKLSNLCDELTKILEEEGISGKKYQSHLLKACLTGHFSDQLSFHRLMKRNEAEYVFN